MTTAVTDNRIPNAPFRAAVEASSMELADIARALEWFDGRGKPDTQRLQRKLGMACYLRGGTDRQRHEWVLQQFITYETAVAIVLVLGRDPVEFGV